MRMSASCTCGKGNINHNFNSNSRKSQHHIDNTKIQNNIILKDISIDTLETEFNAIFEEDVENYNSKQKQKCRQIQNYYQKCLKDKKITAPYRELIYQIGNREDAKDPIKKEKMLNTLIRFELQFERTYPQLKVIGAVIHVDEATPHLHLDVVPYAEGGKNGLKHKVNWEKALEQMGFEPEYSKINKKEKAKPLVFNGFRNHSMKLLEQIGNDEGIERQIMNNTKEHKDTETFKGEQELIKQINEKNIIIQEQQQEISRLNKFTKFLSEKLEKICNWFADKIFFGKFSNDVENSIENDFDTDIVEEINNKIEDLAEQEEKFLVK